MEMDVNSLPGELSGPGRPNIFTQIICNEDNPAHRLSFICLIIGKLCILSHSNFHIYINRLLEIQKALELLIVRFPSFYFGNEIFIFKLVPCP
jgi:hypothetical protein